ncbi:Uncharacterized protein APZ42_027067 [Daphnia magna]|uniref:Uncharacterized protein n=1 Tax=Daphnia magna TaxID=35525 RepID=A0A164RRD1_9CRUS|nr:Uncharacterized protein APZ42_027067 [Daphnia magna]
MYLFCADPRLFCFFFPSKNCRRMGGSLDSHPTMSSRLHTFTQLKEEEANTQHTKHSHKTH